MLKYSLPATALLVVGLTACLDDPAGPECSPLTNTVVENRGDTIVTSSGLRYIETEIGTGSIEASWCNGARVEMVGTLEDGTQFASGPYDLIPGLTREIPGFQMGVVGMKIDGNRRLIIPPELGFGSVQNGDIPPNSILIFDLELIEVEQ
jgi:peptidylprolyl isomerase